jgi:flagellin-specific chaperone FliS
MNYDTMNKLEEIIEKLESLVQQDLNDQVTSNLDKIKIWFNETYAAAEEKEADMEAALVEKYHELVAKVHQKIDTSKNQKASEESNNLTLKREIIEALKKLSEEVNSLGESYNLFNALKDKWKSIGNVPEKQYLNLQRDYRFYNEKFHYNIGLYKESKEVDLKKNLQLKEELLERLKQISEKVNIKEIENQVRTLQNEWDEIGPTFNEEWERLRDLFKEYLNTAYQKIQEHHHVIFESMMANMKL